MGKMSVSVTHARDHFLSSFVVELWRAVVAVDGMIHGRQHCAVHNRLTRFERAVTEHVHWTCPYDAACVCRTGLACCLMLFN